MTHFPQSFGLDLADTLASDFELLAHLLESSAIAVDESESKRKDALLAFGQTVENVDNLFSK